MMKYQDYQKNSQKELENILMTEWLKCQHSDHETHISHNGQFLNNFPNGKYISQPITKIFKCYQYLLNSVDEEFATLMAMSVSWFSL